MTLRALADANFPLPVVKALRAKGADVARVTPELSAISDVEVLAWAWRDRRVVLTQDKDFRGLTLHDRHPCVGLVLLRLRQAGGWISRAEPVVDLLLRHQNAFPGAVTTFDDAGLHREPFP